MSCNVRADDVACANRWTTNPATCPWGTWCRAAAWPQSNLAAAPMKIVILRGGAPVRRRRDTAASTGGRGVMAIGDESGGWALVNMSPAVAHQLATDQRLPDRLADAAARVVLLTDAQVDHVGGLLSLRDGPPLALYATPAVFEALTTELPILPVLQHYCGVHWHVIPVAGDTPMASFAVEGLPGLEFTAVATDAPALPHAPWDQQPRVGDSVALAVRDLVSGRQVFCAPGVSQIGPTEFDWMRQADCLLIDPPAEPETTDQPTIWMDLLKGMPAQHKVLFSAPARDHDRDTLAEQGIALAYDGMAIEL